MTPEGFLDHYFSAVYNKLEADALLFNRKLPHAGLVGSENERALADLLQDFLPPRYGVEQSAIIIDRHQKASRQCDIVLYDAWQYPKYLRKVFPIEVVYGVIEVKTNLTAGEANRALTNLHSVSTLDFRPMLSPYWETRSRNEHLVASPPFGAIFAFRSQPAAFETMAAWFPRESVLKGLPLRLAGDEQKYPEIRTLTISALDKGLIMMESSNRFVQRWVTVAHGSAEQRSFQVTVDGCPVLVDPAKTLFVFLERIWQQLWQHELHPGFDIRSYLSFAMDVIIDKGTVED